MATQEGVALPNEQYTIAWICAIQCELKAARMILDTLGKIHADHTRQQKEGDKNTYLLGEIQGHNVVVAALPSGQYGTNSATRVAEHMLRSFTNVRIGLMVGIAGGAPVSRKDIRLGDVVVGIPGSGHSGVLHYRFGKTIQGEEFQITAHHNSPPQLLLSACDQLQVKLDLATDNALDDYVQKALQGRRPKVVREFGRPDSSTDRLYASDFIHRDQDRSCKDICDAHPTKIVDRTEWLGDRSKKPGVFYGLIASADELMKDASFRDQLSSKRDVLCFEMEAAGLANSFPCLVVRGICDYSDTHKNKSWQGYAALVAAAYATLLLGMIPAEDVKQEKELIAHLEELKKSNQEVHVKLDEFHLTEQHKKIKTWLNPSNASDYLRDAQDQRSPGSGEWLMKSTSVQKWWSGQQSFLWLSGLPGCGKTILSSAIIEALMGSGSICLYFYITSGDHTTTSFDRMLRTLVWQLFVQSEPSRESLHKLYQACQQGSSDDARAPPIKQFKKGFSDMLQLDQQIWLVVDALDEMATGESRDELIAVIAWITDLATTHDNLHLLVTSRDEEHIRSSLGRFCGAHGSLSISGQGLDKDIENHIEERIKSGPLGVRWAKRRDELNLIKERLVEKAGGMFRYVACQLDDLENCLDGPSLRRTLNNLPNDIQGIYDRAIKKLSKAENPQSNSTTSNKPQKLIRILQFLLYSERPLTVEELVDVIAINLDHSMPFDPNDRMPQPREIALYCSSLAKLVASTRLDKKTTELHLAHYTVREYLVSAHCPYADDLEESTARASIAITCMSYIRRLELTMDSDSYMWIRLPLDRSSDRMYPGAYGPLSYKEVQAAYPLLSYGSTQLMQHTAATVASKPKVFDVALEFLNDNEPCYTIWRQFDLEWPPYESDAVLLEFKSTQDTSFHGPLYRAIMEGMSFDFVKALLYRLKAEDPASESRHLDHGLEAACETLDLGLMQFLLERISMKDTPMGPTITGTHLECLTSYPEGKEQAAKKAVKLFLSYANNWNDEDGFDALIWALESDSQDMVRILIENRPACVNWREDGLTPLEYTLKHLNDDMTVLLLENGACWEEVYSTDFGNEEESDDVDSTSMDRETSSNLQLWQKAVRSVPDGLPKTTQWLVSNKPDCFSGEDLNLVASVGNARILQILLQGLDWSRSQLDAALTRAAGSERSEAVALLLRHGANFEPESGASQKGKKGEITSLPDGQKQSRKRCAESASSGVETLVLGNRSDQHLSSKNTQERGDGGVASLSSEKDQGHKRRWESSASLSLKETETPNEQEQSHKRRRGLSSSPSPEDVGTDHLGPESWKLTEATGGAIAHKPRR